MCQMSRWDRACGRAGPAGCTACSIRGRQCLHGEVLNSRPLLGEDSPLPLQTFPSRGKELTLKFTVRLKALEIAL
ncbi:hypothetical protein GJAV_G00218100 [Gymnothorax javanicus]|nr:hypothetical protein GJAV_G00218100 [Gymnothorax javanicus]